MKEFSGESDPEEEPQSSTDEGFDDSHHSDDFP
jgi:hypothetical protein